MKILSKWKTARFNTYSITTSEWLIRRNPAHCWKDLSPSPLINFNWFRLINGPLFSRHSIKLLAFVWFNPATLLRQIKIINRLHCTISAFYTDELKNSSLQSLTPFVLDPPIKLTSAKPHSPCLDPPLQSWHTPQPRSPVQLSADSLECHATHVQTIKRLL